jgi:outer membrane receptor protein involved in Fe transport
MACNLFILALLAFVLAGTIQAQGPVGTLNGTIMDPAGAVVPNATVTATSNATGVESKTMSTSSGTYTLPYLPAGTYTVRATAAGFEVSTAENVILRVAQTMVVDLRLQVGAVTQEVVVSAKPELLESGSAEMGSYITTQEYQDWPILVSDGQRQLQQFIFDSLPGTTGDTFAGSINGGQQYSHEILVEGIPVGRSDLSGGNMDEFSPSAEAVGEFKLQTGAISAQYNGGQTAVANFQVKSGTNSLHGSAFYYVGNEDFNSIPLQSKTFGVTRNPMNRLNNWGYSLGGPVYIPKVYNGRNKTFWFTNFEYTKTTNLPYSGYVTLPPVAQKKGDFSCLLNPACTGNAKSGTTIGTDGLGNPIVFGQIYDPRSTQKLPDGSYVRTPFHDNQIPASEWDPVATNIIQNVGITDPQFETLFNNQQRIGTCCPFFRLHTVGLKIDHHINDKNQISGYYNQSYRNRDNHSCGNRKGPYLPLPGPATNCAKGQITPGNMGRVSLTTTITTSLINRAAGGINRFLNENGVPLQDTPAGGWAQAIGLTGLAPSPLFPTMTFSGANYQGGTISPLGRGSFSYDPNGSYIFQDDLTWIHGKHSFRFGYDYRRYLYTDRSVNSPGSFGFSPLQTALPGYNTQTGDAFASFLLGAANSASQNIVGYTSGFRQPQHALYAMDDWKVTPKLTVNLGLRWEIIPPLYEVTNRMSEVSLSVPDPGAANLPGALIFGGPFNDTYWKEFGPRFGVAYRLTNKVVLRAGYAMTNTPPIANSFNYVFTYGYTATNQLNALPSPHDPRIYLSQPFPAYPGTIPNTDPSGAEFNYQSFTTARDANRPGYVQNYNFTIQYELPHSTVVELAYIGNKGTRLWGGQSQAGAWVNFSELNGLPSTLLGMGDTLTDAASAHPSVIPYAGFPADNYSVAQALLPHPQYQGIEEAFPYNQNANYNAFQVTVTRHFQSGLGFLAGYTWSKAIGYVDQNGAAAYYTYVQDFYNRKLERATTTFSIPQNFKLTWIYDLPFGKGRHWDLGRWLNPVLGGWQFAAIHNYQSGLPVTVNTNLLTIPSGFGAGIRPDVLTGVPLTVADASTHVDVQNPTQWLNPNAFALQPTSPGGVPLRVGTAPRTFPALRGPANLSEKFRIAKQFPFREGKYLEIGAVMTNPLKRTYATINDTTYGDSTFGTLLQGGGDRVLQLNARIQF